MVIKRSINVQHEKLSSGLSAALGVCSSIESSMDNDDILDFSHTQFITPTFILPMLIYISTLDKSVSLSNLTDYMKCLYVDSLGVDSCVMRKSEFSAFMEKFSLKRYIPIVKFPTAKNRIDDKDYVISTIESILIRQSSLASNIVNGLKYMIAEIVDNITEHSHSPNGFIVAQCYKAHGYMDICIGDTGVTLLGAYKNHYGYEIETDAEAMKAANSGISTKNLPFAENRGYGIKTSKKMLVDGLGGQYIMVSGNTVYGKTPENEGYIELPKGLRFKGTIVAIRIPIKAKEGFSYIEYVE